MTENVTIKDIIQATNGKLLNKNFDTSQIVQDVTIDSRVVTKNSLFVPIKGKNIDPHTFIPEVFSKGAVVAFSEIFIATENILDGAVIQVSNTLTALQDLARFYRKLFQIPVIGVTGSVGKSTTKEMLSLIISDDSAQVLKTDGNLNGQIGLPLTILKLNSQHKVTILEMGVSLPGEMEKLSQIAQPDIAIITNIGTSHLEAFGTPENIFEEKIKIIDKNSEKFNSCKYYLNGDNPVIYRMVKKIGLPSENIVFFGINGDYKYLAENISQSEAGTEFTVTKVTSSEAKFQDTVFIPTLGIHNVYNAIAAISVALDTGLSINSVKSRIRKYKPIKMRQQIIHLKDDILLMDDSYNSSPDSVKSAISVFKLINHTKSGKNIVVLGDMLELGEMSDKFHHDIGKYLALENIDVLLLKGEKCKHIKSGFMSVNNEKNTIVEHFDDNQSLISSLCEKIEANCKILIKGSRGMNMDEVSKFLKSEFTSS